MLHRQIEGHWVWNNEKYFRAWVWMILRANHKENKVLIKSTLYTVKRGQFLTSLSNMSDAIKMGRQSVRTFLRLLEQDKMINTQATRNLTQITICNYNDYNSKQHTDKQKSTHKQHTSNTPLTTDNNEKKENNEKKDNKLLSELKDSDLLNEHEEIALSFWELFNNNLKKLNITSTDLSKAKYKNWVDPIRLMINTDLRKKDELREIWGFLNNEDLTKDFTWSSNIRSTSKLREKFERLLTEARKNQSGNYTQHLINKLQDG